MSLQHMKEVIYTQLRDHLKELFKGSLEMIKKEIPDHHLIKLRVISNNLREISKCNLILYWKLNLIAKIIK